MRGSERRFGHKRRTRRFPSPRLRPLLSRKTASNRVPRQSTKGSSPRKPKRGSHRLEPGGTSLTTRGKFNVQSGSGLSPARPGGFNVSTASYGSAVLARGSEGPPGIAVVLRGSAARLEMSIICNERSGLRILMAGVLLVVASNAHAQGFICVQLPQPDIETKQRIETYLQGRFQIGGFRIGQLFGGNLWNFFRFVARAR